MEVVQVGEAPASVALHHHLARRVLADAVHARERQPDRVAGLRVVPHAATVHVHGQQPHPEAPRLAREGVGGPHARVFRQDRRPVRRRVVVAHPRARVGVLRERPRVALREAVALEDGAGGEAGAGVLLGPAGVPPRGLHEQLAQLGLLRPVLAVREPLAHPLRLGPVQAAHEREDAQHLLLEEDHAVRRRENPVQRRGQCGRRLQPARAPHVGMYRGGLQRSRAEERHLMRELRHVLRPELRAEPHLPGTLDLKEAHGVALADLLPHGGLVGQRGEVQPLAREAQHVLPRALQGAEHP